MMGREVPPAGSGGPPQHAGDARTGAPSATGGEGVLAWVLPEASPLRSDAFSRAIEELGHRHGFRSLYVSTEASLRPAGLEDLLSRIRGTLAVLFEIPSGDSIDPLLFLLLGTIRGAHRNVVLCQGPGSKPLPPRVRELLHSPVLEFTDPLAMAGSIEGQLPREGLSATLTGPLPSGGKPPTPGATPPPAQLGWSDWRTAQALLARGTMMGQMNLVSDEVVTYEEIASRFGSNPDTRLREVVIRARVNEGTALRLLGRIEEALRAFQQASEMARTQEGAQGLESHLRSLVLWGEFLGELGRYEESLSKYEEALRPFPPEEGLGGPATAGAKGPAPAGGTGIPEVRMWTARALLDKGNTLHAMGRPVEALATYEGLAGRFGTEDPTDEVTGLVAEALMNQGITLTDLGRKPEALEVYASLIRRFDTTPESILVEQVVKARINRGMIFGEAGAFPQEAAEYADVARRLAGCRDPRLMNWQARALLNQGASLAQMRRHREALAQFGEVVRLFESSEDPALMESVARAMLSEAETLVLLGQDDESSFVVHELLGRFDGNPEPNILAVVTEAMDLKSRLPPPPR